MSRRLVIRPEAEAELTEAHDWYEKQRSGLGNQFLSCVHESLVSLQGAPERYPVVYRDVRRTLVRRFPYCVFYVLTKTGIVVLAGFHASRDPKQWQERI